MAFQIRKMQILTKFTPNEISHVLKEAKKRNLKKSTYVRECALRGFRTWIKNG